MEQRHDRAATDQAGFLALAKRHRHALWGGVLALFLIGWFSDDFLAWFAQKPTATQIAGSWKFDENEFSKSLATVVESMPAAQRTSLQQDLTRVADSYRGLIYSFEADGYTIIKGSQRDHYRCTYTGVPRNVLILRPGNQSGARSLTLLLDTTHDHIYISIPEMAIPLCRMTGNRPR